MAAPTWRIFATGRRVIHALGVASDVVPWLARGVDSGKQRRGA